MVAWMLYSAAVALVVAASARAAEWLARLGGYGVRWVWAGALALTVFLSGSSVLREAAPVALATTQSPAIDLSAASQVQRDASWRRALSMRLEIIHRVLEAPLRSVVATVRRRMSPAVNVFAASLSAAISLGLALILVGVGRRFRRARREWPLVAMQGIDVRVAPRIGPVVIGFMRPEIVVPRWLLTRPADEQRLVVTHENEHVRARDPLLLGLGWGAVVVAPWNPAVWYMVSRLRLAVELDCDVRVLRRGAVPRSYGSLLIDVAQHASALRLSALALADDSSHLRQRILAMKRSVPRFAPLRGGLAAAFALAGVLVACQATLPTDAEIERMDVAAATRTARELAKAKHADTAVTYTVDGAKATLSDVSALAPSELGRVQIVTGTPGTGSQVNIDTRRLPPRTPARELGRTQRTARVPDVVAPLVDSTTGAAPSPSMSKVTFTGLIFIDGVRSTESQMRLLDRKQIESVDVLKGPYAAQEYGDPDAAKGVIAIRTKRGGAK